MYKYNGDESSDILERALCFVVTTARMINKFPKTTAGFKIGDQLIRSSGSIGANIAEAKVARSKKEFVSCLGISLREAEETRYWLRVIKRLNFAIEGSVKIMISENTEIIKILVAIINNTRKNHFK